MEPKGWEGGLFVCLFVCGKEIKLTHFSFILFLIPSLITYSSLDRYSTRKVYFNDIYFNK